VALVLVNGLGDVGIPSLGFLYKLHITLYWMLWLVLESVDLWIQWSRAWHVEVTLSIFLYWVMIQGYNTEAGVLLN